MNLCSQCLSSAYNTSLPINCFGVGHKRRKCFGQHSARLGQESAVAVASHYTEAHVTLTQSSSPVSVFPLPSVSGSSQEQQLIAPTPGFASPYSARCMGAQAVPADASNSSTGVLRLPSPAFSRVSLHSCRCPCML